MNGAALARSLAERALAKFRYIYSHTGGHGQANNAKPINFQFQQARIADRVCARLDRPPSTSDRSFVALADPVITLKVKPTCYFFERTKRGRRMGSISAATRISKKI